VENTLYYGDNLDILKRYIPDESIDLVYLDPPFKSSQNYNILFKEKNGSQAASQIRAFEDTWTWGQDDEAVYADLVTKDGKVADCLQAFRTFMGPCDMLAYLVMMAPRLAELRRVMKPSASIYLHCDPAASHYLKMLMDGIFKPTNFKNEVYWKRSTPHGTAKRKYGVSCDILLFYTKTDTYTWNTPTIGLRPGYISKYYSCFDQKGRRFQPTSLLGHRGVNPEYEWHGIVKPWRYPPHRLDELEKNGMIYWPSKGGVPRFRRYLDENAGQPVLSLWDDIPPVNSQAKERLGYPTQKPEALLERIIKASSNEGDLVLDPFCGCGTTIAAAQKSKRRWIGIDITYLAIALMKVRLADAFGDKVAYKVIGEPVSVPDAAALAESDPFQFQCWAVSLVVAHPVEQKKGADKGIDGKIIFQGEKPGEFETVILSVKAGGIHRSHVHELRGVVEREKAAIGVLISMEDPTRQMKEEAVTAGFFESKTWGKKYPKIQLLTIAELLAGKKIEMPPIRQVGATFKKAARHRGSEGKQLSMEDLEK